MSEKNGHHLNGSPGGSGGNCALSTEDRESVQNTRLLERAVREQWPIPFEMREEVVRRQIDIAIGEESSPRERTSAARCLVSMTQQNQAALFKALDKEVPDLLEIGTSKQQEARSAILSDAEYLAYREQKRLAPSHSGTNGHAKNGHNGNGHV